MKKLVYLALLVTVGFVVGCKQESADSAAQSAAQSEATNAAPATK